MLLSQIRAISADPEKLTTSGNPTVFHEFMKAKDRSIMSETAFLGEGWLFLIAGTDTSSNSLAAGTLSVLGDPEIHAKLVKELLEAWPRLEDRPRCEDLESLPYLVGCPAPVTER